MFFSLSWIPKQFERMEKVALRSSTTQAKIIGTIVSISGALVVVLYKGPKVFTSLHWTSSSVLRQWPLESSSESNWVIGGVLIAVAYLLYSFWYIIQVKRIFSEESCFLFSCIQFKWTRKLSSLTEFEVFCVLQTQVMEMYPQELTVAFFYNLCATFIAIPVSLIAESNFSSWRLTPSIAVVAVLYSVIL